MRDLSGAAIAPRDTDLSFEFAASSVTRRNAAPAPRARSAKIPPKVYGIMVLTTTLTFATLTTGYELLFPSQLFA